MAKTKTWLILESSQICHFTTLGKYSSLWNCDSWQKVIVFVMTDSFVQSSALAAFLLIFKFNSIGPLRECQVHLRMEVRRRASSDPPPRGRLHQDLLQKPGGQHLEVPGHHLQVESLLKLPTIASKSYITLFLALQHALTLNWKNLLPLHFWRSTCFVAKCLAIRLKRAFILCWQSPGLKPDFKILIHFWVLSQGNCSFE